MIDLIKTVVVPLLTERQEQTFYLIGAGLKTSEIAERLGLSRKTVETYREQLKERLGCENAAQLVREAVLYHEDKNAKAKAAEAKEEKAAKGAKS